MRAVRIAAGMFLFALTPGMLLAAFALRPWETAVCLVGLVIFLGLLLSAMEATDSGREWPWGKR